MTKRKPAKKKRMKPVVAWAIVEDGKPITRTFDCDDNRTYEVYPTKKEAKNYGWDTEIIKVKITQA